jgi:hypothetical protein
MHRGIVRPAVATWFEATDQHAAPVVRALQHRRPGGVVTPGPHEVTLFPPMQIYSGSSFQTNTATQSSGMSSVQIVSLLAPSTALHR